MFSTITFKVVAERTYYKTLTQHCYFNIQYRVKDLAIFFTRTLFYYTKSFIPVTMLVRKYVRGFFFISINLYLLTNPKNHGNFHKLSYMCYVLKWGFRFITVLSGFLLKYGVAIFRQSRELKSTFYWHMLQKSTKKFSNITATKLGIQY